MVGRKRILVAILALVLIVFFAQLGQALYQTPTTTEPTTVEPKEGPPNNLDPTLWRLVEAYERGEAESFACRHGLELQDGTVKVIVEAYPGEAEAVQEAAEALGAIVDGTHRDLLRIWVPIPKLAELADSPSVGLVRRPLPGGPGEVETATIESAVNANRCGRT